MHLTEEEYRQLQERIKGNIKKVNVEKTLRKKKCNGYGLFIPFIKLHKLQEPTPEYKFHPTRKWRFDFAWVEQKIALEIEGGVWTKGRHGRPSGIIKDMKKHNGAMECGWRFLRVEPENLYTQNTIDMLKKLLYKSS